MIINVYYKYDIIIFVISARPPGPADIPPGHSNAATGTDQSLRCKYWGLGLTLKKLKVKSDIFLSLVKGHINSDWTFIK